MKVIFQYRGFRKNPMQLYVPLLEYTHNCSFNFGFIKGDPVNFLAKINPLYTLIKRLNLNIINIKIGKLHVIFTSETGVIIGLKLNTNKFPNYKSVIPAVDEFYKPVDFNFLKNAEFPFTKDKHGILLTKEGTGFNSGNSDSDNLITYLVKDNTYDLDFPVSVNLTQIQDYLKYHPDSKNDTTLFIKDHESFITNKSGTFVVGSLNIDANASFKNIDPERSIYINNPITSDSPKPTPVKKSKKIKPNTNSTNISLSKEDLTLISDKFKDIARENIDIKFYDGFFEAFGSEIAMHRLFYHYKNFKNNISFKNNLNKWAFTFFNNYRLRS